ncbi:ferredoxin domain-containing protein [Xiamenia xianingshaonis]|uniref:Ferredoxin n=1 Tax=Xiamenia xianingshaonis TaxID=2682776 RepID=A0A9E6SU86_9ACTN|nr:DUF2148 domain-containing protein [Xiamenia xianingshaonis]NHM14976.1 ferredoxin [Xiamenia xianingshaonis]QTU84007.1 hypothetical protein J7S26_06475 [Xiamenia xianingshaonis]
MITNERDAREESALDIAKKMLVAARTAPKGKGVDIVECAVVAGDDKETLAAEMEAYSAETGFKFLLRDADNVRQSQCVVIVGTRHQAQGLNCGHCGFPTCSDKPEATPCEVNSVDVGIALGSAVALAADFRADSRIMFSAGMAAQRLGWLGEDVREVYAIPVSISSKSPFFDRPSRK